MDSDDEKKTRPKGSAPPSSKRPFIRPGNSMKETRIEMPVDEDDDERDSGPSSGPPPPPRKDKRNMRGLWDQYKNFIIGIVIVALIIAIAYWFFAYKPKLDKLKQDTEGRGPGSTQRMTARKGVRFTDQHGQPLEQVREYEIEQEETDQQLAEQSDDNQSAPIRPPPRDPRETIITASDAPASEHAPLEMGRTPPSSRNIDPKRVVSARDLIKVPLASKGDMNHDDVLRRNEEEGIMREQVVSGDVITNPSVSSSTDPLLVE